MEGVLVIFAVGGSENERDFEGVLDTGAVPVSTCTGVVVSIVVELWSSHFKRDCSLECAWYRISTHAFMWW